jgi:hypothetical protein
MSRTFLAVVIAFCVLTIGLIACGGKEWLNDPRLNNEENRYVTSSVEGRVMDESGSPIAGALAEAGKTTAITDANGYFRINNVVLNANYAVVTIAKSDYFKTARTFVAEANKLQTVSIKLVTKGAGISVNSQSGGTIQLVNGVQIIFPIEAFVKKSTFTSYVGNGLVNLSWIAPTGLTQTDDIPGILKGIGHDSKVTPLDNYGIMAVELNSPAGEELFLTPGRAAQIRFPVTGNGAAAPLFLELWHFNEASGLWVQEGYAEKVGNYYTASVSHFSYWAIMKIVR